MHSTTKTYQIDISVFIQADSLQEAEYMKEEFANNISGTADWDVLKITPPREITEKEFDDALDYDPPPAA